MPMVRVSNGGTQGFSMLHTMPSYRYKFLITTDLTTYTQSTILNNTQSCTEFSVTQTSSNPFTLTATILKAGYYRIQALPTDTPSWVYKAANSTISLGNDNTNAGNYIMIFCWKDLQQH